MLKLPQLGVSASIVALAAACGVAGPPSTRGPVPTAHAPGRSVSSAGPSQSGSAAAATSTGTPSAAQATALRRTLVEPRPVTRPLWLLPVTGQRSALAVSNTSDGGSIIRRIGEDGFGPYQLLAAEAPVAVFDLPRPQLLTSDGRRLCLRTIDAVTSEFREPQCLATRADLAFVLGDRVALLEQRVDRPKPAPGSAKAKKRGKTSRTKGRKPRRGKKPRRGRKSRKTKNLHRAVDPKPVPMRVWLRRASAAGVFEAEAHDTKLTFARPIPGMALVDAVGVAGRGAVVLHHEHKKAKRKGRKSIAQGRLRSVELDLAGKLRSGSRRTVFEGDRRYGYIQGHHRPRLFGHAGKALFVGRYSRNDGSRTAIGFEAKTLRPWGVSRASNAAYATDPWGLLHRRAKPARTALLKKLVEQQPRLVPHQSQRDAGRVAWVGERGYYLCDDGLCSISLKDGAIRREDPPFAPHEAPLHWGFVEAGGRGLAATDAALIEMAADGSLKRHAWSPSVGQRQRPHRAVRIASSWWALQPSQKTLSGYVLTRLLPDAYALNTLAVSPDNSFVVGGVSHGWLVSLQLGGVKVQRLAADGSLTPAGEITMPLRSLFDAVASGGQLLLIGRDRGGKGVLLKAPLTAEGDMQGAQWWPLPLTNADRELRLSALPTGGALVTDASRSFAIWLAAKAGPSPRVPWPGGAGRCGNGAPVAKRLPGLKWGEWRDLSAASVGVGAVELGCSASLPQHVADGGVRWWCRRRDPAAPQVVHAEVVMLPAAARERLPLVATIAASAGSAVPAGAVRARVCPPDMVSIAGDYCIDRFEAQLVHTPNNALLSPHYPSEPGIVEMIHKAWSGGRFFEGDLHARAIPLPALLRDVKLVPKPRARSRRGVIPSGFVSGYSATKACANAGKRQCKAAEWKRACRGEQDRRFPYGDKYQEGVCNVFRHTHPAAVLHGNAAVGHLDPRLNLVRGRNGKLLLQPTGRIAACASRWGDDAVYDMVGNLDEWLDDKKGAFAGGFYARSTRNGCSSKITGHPRRYVDYSLGVRCCLDVAAAGGPR